MRNTIAARKIAKLRKHGREKGRPMQKASGLLSATSPYRRGNQPPRGARPPPDVELDVGERRGLNQGAAATPAAAAATAAEAAAGAARRPPGESQRGADAAPC